MAQITDNLMKKTLWQAIFMGCPTFKFSHHKKDFPSSSYLEIFYSDHQVRENTAQGTTNAIPELMVRDAVFHLVIW